MTTFDCTCGMGSECQCNATRSQPGSRAADTCLVCGHEWERHDPEDGQCDAFAVDGSGVCQCGRNLAFTQKWNAYLSRMALGRLRTPE